MRRATLAILPVDMGLKEPWIAGCGELGCTDFYFLAKTLWNEQKALQTHQESRALVMEVCQNLKNPSWALGSAGVSGRLGGAQNTDQGP